MADKNNLKDYKGLSCAEAQKKLNIDGPNTLIKRKKLNPFIAYLKQFIDPMVILLLISAAVSLGLGIYEHLHGNKDRNEIIIGYVEPAIILLVVMLNSLLGAYQEIKSDQAVRALEKVNEVNATVIRDNKAIIIPASRLVVGDLVLLAAGDTISADGQLITSNNLEIVEAALTGESLPVAKKANYEAINNKILAENKHLVYSGTYVTNGKATYIVSQVAANTEIGKINSMIQKQPKTVTPLQNKLNKLGKWFGYMGIVLMFLSFIVQLILNNVSTGKWNNPDVYTNALVTGISLAVAAIPEGLITFTTILLSIGVAKLSKEKALVKNLLAVETLGSASIICSDKTGTLTENKMKVVDIYYQDKILDEINKNNYPVEQFAKYMVLCNDAFINLETDGTFKEVGDPTETGLLRFAHSYNITKENCLNETPVLHSLPFDSDRKMSSVLIKNNKDNLIITKGAPDSILSRCKNIDKEKILKLNNEWANKTYRVLAFAIKKTKANNIDFKDEDNLEFIGLVAMIDPPRAAVANSVKEAQGAGIKVIMITGDQLTTAKAIAKNLGIYQDNDICLEGKELALMSDEELFNKVEHISVYARVNPEDKLRIVKAWQKHDQVVAMTGDGVNDAPALKASDIGCAMGITGTDVSKQAADLILVDDNFNTIVRSVKNGRLIFDKIKNVILNMLISSLTEVLVIFIGMIAFYLAFKDHYKENEFYILGAGQLLWINLLTHGLPAIALGFVDSGKDVMKRKPYNKKESIFARGMGFELLWQSCLLSLLSLISYTLGAKWAIDNNKDVAPIASSTAFITMGLAASINSINLMSDKSIFASSIKKYWPVYLAALSSALFILLVSLVPNIAKVFRMSENYVHEGILMAYSMPSALGLTFVHEIKKMIINIKNKHY